ncbi:Pyrimidine dimer DNA glycosylase [Lacticaseibacillus paracasei]|nr:Pyrimidine dimer DNA glycosylase [Lacticaseibacillus paracasei]
MKLRRFAVMDGDGNTLPLITVLREMEKRGYHPDQKWYDPLYRGQHCPAYKQLNPVALTIPIYPEHDQRYKHVCLTNLQNKGIFLNLP